MADMTARPFKPASNVAVLNAVRGLAGSDYQARIPAATKSNVQETIQSMWDDHVARNAFIDALVNKIGSQIIRFNTWNNPLAKYKRGLLAYGETIEEVMIGLLNAYVYSSDREELERSIFGREANEVQSRYHTRNRQNYYKLTVNELDLRAAFYAEGGLSRFVAGLMASINTSDNWDEFLLMSRLFRTNYEENGFFKVKVPDLLSGTADANDAKEFLTQARTFADTLPFLSRKYNAAKMPVVAQKQDLELILTPRGQAVIDVQALSAAFNVDSANISSRTTIVPEEYLDIPNCQAILTTKDFFVVADNLMTMRNAQNPVGLHQNYFWHHWETISISPFVPAILFSSEEETPIIVQDSNVTGITALTLIDDTGATVTSAKRDGIYQVLGAATVSISGASNTGLTYEIQGKTSTRTRIAQNGILLIGIDEKAQSIVIHAKATDDNAFTKDLTVPITGALIAGSIGATVDDDGNPATPNA